MLTKEFRFGEDVVVIEVNEETRHLEIKVNGEVIKSGDLKEETTPESCIEDFTEETAQSAVFEYQTQVYFDTPRDYSIVKSHEVANGSLEVSILAEKEDQRFVAFQVRDVESGEVVAQTRKELADDSCVRDAVDGFEEEIANAILAPMMLFGSF